MRRNGVQIFGPSRSFQPDIASENVVSRGSQQRQVSFTDVIKYLDSRNVPPQLRQTPYVVKIAALNTPYLLIPANPNRMSFNVIGSGADASFAFVSYNYPLKSSAGNYMGFPVSNSQNFSEGNGTVSIDDIYITAIDEGLAGSSFLAYEGVLAIESHLHMQTQI